LHIVNTASFPFHGHRLHYEEHGSGRRVIVLMHGLLLDANVNRNLARAFAGAGYRVVLLDLLGHGRSDKPEEARLHRFDRYAEQVIALLDHLEVDKAVIGGVSLGAGVALQVAVTAPDRVSGLIAEMPVMEEATPFAALLFVPLLLGVQFGGPVSRWVSRFWARVPRTRQETLNSVLNMLSAPPGATAAVLHGILVGPVAPDVERRRGIRVPTLVIGHKRDRLHPFTDATNLVEEIPRARFLQARSLLELRVRPQRLTGQIIDFVDTEVFGSKGRRARRAAS
jgi:pimeloyl-ACP methyl ester carboxylesterase